MAKPKLLLMDRTSMGLAPKIVEEIARIIGEIGDRRPETGAYRSFWSSRTQNWPWSLPTTRTFSKRDHWRSKARQTSRATANMSARRILASDAGDVEMRSAPAAAWRRTDLVWKRLQVCGNAAWVNGAHIDARRNFLIAWWLPRICFSRGDPQVTTGSANVGSMAREAGQIARTSRHYARAQRLWVDVPRMVGGLQFRPRVRSSLFHLRMETRRRGTYEENMRTRITKIVTVTGDTLDAAVQGNPSPHRLHSRWRGE